ncbi:hypothetical protein [Rivibacter subsaxonicus]|uniref:Uncharacterized protein n=1 Tax=Rivibacter subsaxonicus TaxID=457575 RepID=A0A4Q7VNB1_9BURK|nr:hypothetical protein [Rivibacter subsaxonicus]RZT97833.1 hypothetical protein EV670_2233 [Rivibacter subsaxonicus]
MLVRPPRRHLAAPITQGHDGPAQPYGTQFELGHHDEGVHLTAPVDDDVARQEAYPFGLAA